MSTKSITDYQSSRSGFPALERGYNVIIYEGPGHVRVVREQTVGFIYDWEQAVTPIVDYIFANKASELAFIDTTKIALLGYSLGGYMAARAAAFEPRLAAAICVDGVYGFIDACLSAFPECKAVLVQGDEKTFNELFEKTSPGEDTKRRWIREQLKFTFAEKSGFKIFQTVTKMDVSSVVAKINMPIFM